MTHFDDVLQNLMVSSGGTSGAARAMRLWRRMRDPRVSKHAVGLHLLQKKAGPELLVYVDGPAWAQEFQMMGPAILTEWNLLCQRDGLDMQARTVRFQVSSRVHAVEPASPEIANPYSPADLPGLTDAEREQIELQVSVISDSRLRERVRSAMTGMFRWKKVPPDGQNGL